jgi:hypothetical protein
MIVYNQSSPCQGRDRRYDGAGAIIAEDRVAKIKHRRRRPVEIMITGYLVEEFAAELEVPRDIVLEGIRAGTIKAERRGKRWYRIPYSERARFRETAP